MSESLKLSVTLPAKPEAVYQAWLSSREHGAFTGSPAEIDPAPGGAYTAWDGYILGKTLETTPYKRIVQSWRTNEFPEDSPDSRLEVLLEPVGDGTQLTLVHTGIPDGQSQMYREGWEDFYFTPMQEYFSDKGEGQSD